MIMASSFTTSRRSALVAAGFPHTTSLTFAQNAMAFAKNEVIWKMSDIESCEFRYFRSTSTIVTMLCHPMFGCIPVSLETQSSSRPDKHRSKGLLHLRSSLGIFAYLPLYAQVGHCWQLGQRSREEGAESEKVAENITEGLGHYFHA